MSGITDIESYTANEGRPYDGLVFVWHKSAVLKVKLISVKNSHRVIALLSGNRKFIIVGVYLPCFVISDKYERDVMMSVEFIESIFNMCITDLNCTFFILSDFNFDVITMSTCERFSCMQNLLNEYNNYNMVVCDNLNVNMVGYTYWQEKLHHYSVIDNLFICDNDLHLVKEYSVIGTGTNLPDHCAISVTFV